MSLRCRLTIRARAKVTTREAVNTRVAKDVGTATSECDLVLVAELGSSHVISD